MKRKQRRKLIWMVAGLAVLLYLGLAVYFHNHFFPKTTLNGRKAGGYTAQKVMDEITEEIHSYQIKIATRDKHTEKISGQDISLELVVSEKTGLKIPNSAITKKQFYTVPKEYFTQGGDSSDPGLMIENHAGDTGSVTLVQPTIYYETDDFYYIDDETVSAGDVVVKNNSSGTYTIGSDVDKLTGVYNINKGYAVFKQIDILAQNNKYTIVDTGTSYGVALYDHIALDGSKIKENQLVVK